MSEMIRKQIYISKRQEQLLKRLSQARGVSEAEIIRNACRHILLPDISSDVVSRWVLLPHGTVVNEVCGLPLPLYCHSG
jgi:hypothetical protein